MRLTFSRHPDAAAEKLRAPVSVGGFQWRGEATTASRPRRPAGLVQLAVRRPPTNDTATSLRVRIYQFWHAQPPAEVGPAEEWRSLLIAAGPGNGASCESRLQRCGQMGAIPVFTPQHPAAVAADHVRLLTDSEVLIPLSGKSWIATKAVRGGAPIPSRTHPPLHIREGWGAMSLAAAVAADSADWFAP